MVAREGEYMIKGILGDDSMSNLTSASNEASISSSNRTEFGSTLYPKQSLVATANIQTQTAANKKKRNLPGNPDPEAEVVALSPRSLLATNRFVCEICNKGFQRDQNLQLHRRGHNLPWKLKQRTNKDQVKKKVYVCPEPSCVHHHPSRALGDLTGIKKHFCRKHGEKKWKCEKCSKRYAVQSDWKAHSKICGTREYRCDCGTLFSRRDSFITHRAFCDALAEESSRTIIPPPNPLLGPASSTSHHLNLHTLQSFQLKQEQQQSNFKLVPAHPSNELSSQLFIHHQNPNNNLPNSSSSNMFGTSTPHMSATGLLQKAAQIGVTSSSSSSANNMISATSFFSPTTSSNPIMSSTTTGMAAAGGGEYRQFENNTTGFVTGHGLATNYGDNNNKASATFHFGDSVTPGFMEQVHDMHGMMATTASLPCTNFDDGFAIGGGTQFMRGNKENNEGLTRDFLGLRAFPHHRDFLNTTTTSTAAALHQMGSSSSAAASFDHQNQSPWQN